MKKQQDCIGDIAEIRSMMERSSKFLSHTHWAGIIADIYALSGAYVVYKVFHFRPDQIFYTTQTSGSLSNGLLKVILLAILILILAISTTMLLSYKMANQRGEKAGDATSRRLLASMTVP